MREKLRPGRKKGSYTVGKKWIAKQREVDEFYINEVGGTLAPGEHMVDPIHASAMIKEEFGRTPSPSDIVESYLNNTEGKTTDRKGHDVSDQASGENIPVIEDTRDGSLHNANVHSYENFDPNDVRFWIPASEVLGWQERRLAKAGEKRVAHLLADGQS